jgi:hypothetical protein
MRTYSRRKSFANYATGRVANRLVMPTSYILHFPFFPMTRQHLTASLIAHPSYERHFSYLLKAAYVPSRHEHYRRLILA